ncbi:helix-turn-helix domain-containing protein [Streptomyces sp. NPDC048623]|uniref:helix-turn-helix domain-containing protein n=1 Tax=Streptomyces sp. NPDC048623 TaxID=3155761 RepID=UPI00342353AA
MVRHRVCTGGGRCEWFIKAPDARLRAGIGSYRGFRARAGVPQDRLVVPSGRVSLLIGFGGELRVGGGGTGAGTGAGPGAATARHTSVVSGLHTRARVLGHGGELHGVELALAPWAAYRLFGGASLAELGDVLTDPEDVLGARCRTLGERLADAPGWVERFALLDETLLAWTADAAPEHTVAPAVLEAWRLLHQAQGHMRIREVADRTGWSLRHLESRFREQIGLTPKRLARVLRLRRAVGELTAGRGAADAAAVCGFFDQSHLGREFNALMGMPPGRWLATGGTANAAWITG